MGIQLNRKYSYTRSLQNNLGIKYKRESTGVSGQEYSVSIKGELYAYIIKASKNSKFLYKSKEYDTLKEAKIAVVKWIVEGFFKDIRYGGRI